MIPAIQYSFTIIQWMLRIENLNFLSMKIVKAQMAVKIVDVFENLIGFHDLQVIFYYLESGKKIYVALLTDESCEEQKFILDETNEDFCNLLRRIAREDHGLLLSKSHIKLLLEHMQSIAVESENPFI